MRVCMVSDHGCIRVYKEASALLERGIQVDVIAHQAPFGYNLFTTASLWHDPDQLMRSVAASQADIFHVHNEPDWMVSAVRQAVGDNRPIVHDVHDLASMGSDSEPGEEELNAFRDADAIIHVSQPCADYAEKYHGNKKPSIVLPSYVNREFLTPLGGDDAVSWNSICYEGGLSSEGGLYLENENGKWFNMRYWLPFVQAFIEQGWNVGLFAGNSNVGTDYENAGAFLARNVHYPTLLRAMRVYGFGLVGAAIHFPLINASLPNKLFEYISQGVVPVVINASESAKFVTEHGVGVVPEKGDARPLVEQLVEAGKVARRNILEKRHLWTMENQIDKLIGLYEEVI